MRLLKKVTKQLGFHLTFKTADLRDDIYTTSAKDFTVTLIILFLFVPLLLPDSKTQVVFNNAIKNSFNFSFDSWFKVRKPVDTGSEFQGDIGSVQIVNNPIRII